MELLSLDDAVAQIGRALRPSSPRVLHQFWDATPPLQVRLLLAWNARICRRIGVQHRIWTDATAAARLETIDGRMAALFRRIPHPAMRSDLFRLAILSAEGGVYLDADMALRGPQSAELWTFPEAFIFKWQLLNRTNTPNWCIGARAGAPMLAFAAQAAVEAIEEGLEADPDNALRHILEVSGPGRFTRAVGTWMAANPDAVPTIRVEGADVAFRMVQNGRRLLRMPMLYKATKRHWKVASRSQ